MWEHPFNVSRIHHFKIMNKYAKSQAEESSDSQSLNTNLEAVDLTSSSSMILYFMV